MTRKFKAHDVSLDESMVDSSSTLGGIEVETTHWVATLDAHDFGAPDVHMRRTGSTAAEAYDNLRKAVEEQGWELP